MPLQTYDPNADQQHKPGSHDDLPEDKRASAQQIAELEKSVAAPSDINTSGSGVPAKNIENREKNPNDDSINYSGDGGSDKPKRRRWWTKKKAAVAGGIAGVGVGGGLLGLTFLAGPLEFIHIAQILHDTHLSQQENASDGRMGKMFRYFRNGLDAGETRLGFVGSKYKTRILGQMKEIGLEPRFNKTTGYFEGMGVDTTSEKSPYSGMTHDEAVKAIQTDYGGTVRAEGGGKFSVTDVGKNYRASSKALRTSVKAMGDSKLSSAARMRILKKYGFVSWHPLSIVDRKVNASTVDLFKSFKEKWDNRIKNGIEPATGDTSKASTGETDPKTGKPIPPTSEDLASAAGAGKNSKAVLESIKSSAGLKITGGIAAAAGLACALKAVDDNIANIKYYQVIVPMMRVGLDAITVGNQIMSGQDVDPAELNYLAQYFSKTDPTTGKTSSWNDAQSIHSNTGESGGTDMDQGMKDTIAAGKPAWLEWTQNGTVSAICSEVGSVITTVISFGIGVLSGGTVSTAVGFIASAIAAPKLIDYVSNLLAGDAIDFTHLAGAAYGSVADYGAALGANAGALGMGAVALTAQQVSELNADTTQQNQTEFRSQNFFARTFNVYDYRSLASIALSSQTGSLAQNLATTTRGVMGTFASVLKLPFKLYASTVHAAPAPYQYPFKIYGFSKEDLESVDVADPYANADAAAKILDNNNQNGTPDYIQKANDCFGVQITKSSEGWDVIPAKDVNVYDTDNYNPTDCADSGNTDWLKIRFFILDTGTMEGYACAQLSDATSCTNDGEPAPDQTSLAAPVHKAAIFASTSKIRSQINYGHGMVASKPFAVAGGAFS